jgi:hypothetical protein
MPEADLATRHVGAIKVRLVHLSGLAEKTASTEKAILNASVTRREIVNNRLTALRPRVNLDAEAADQYQDLILERGRLDTVIAASHAALPNHRL